ncbi:MAG: flagellar basal body rod protein FlgB [Actinomycetota bacterium]
MFENLSILKIAKARMDWLAQRQEVLAQNIANADTPKYLPKDLKPQNFKEVLAGESVPTVKVAATNSAHIVPEMGPDPFKAVTQRKTYESSMDGNSVVLEEQMAKMGEAKSAYDTAASLFQKHIAMIRTALGSR